MQYIAFSDVPMYISIGIHFNAANWRYIDEDFSVAYLLLLNGDDFETFHSFIK